MIPYNPGGGSEYDDSSIYLELSKKANKAELLLKADASSVYSKTETDEKLELKADEAELELKADASSVYSKTETDNKLLLKADEAELDLKADISSVYSKTETDNKLLLKADISNVYSKSETDNKLELKADTLWVSNQISKNNSINENVVNSTYIKRNNGIEINNGSYSDLIFLNGSYYGIRDEKLWKFDSFNDSPEEIVVAVEGYSANFITCLTKKNETTMIIGCYYYHDDKKQGHSIEYDGSTFSDSTRNPFGERIPEKIICVIVGSSTRIIILFNSYNYYHITYSSANTTTGGSRTPDNSIIKDIVIDPNDLYKIYLISETGLFYGTYNTSPFRNKILDGNCTSLAVYNNKPVVVRENQIVYDSEVILNDSGDIQVLNNKLYVINKNRIYNLTDSKMINYYIGDIIKTVNTNNKIYILTSDKIFSFSSVDDINYELINVNTAANDSLVIKTTTDNLDSRITDLEIDPVTKSYVDTQDTSLSARLDILENAPSSDVTKSYVDSRDTALGNKINTLENDLILADPREWTTASYLPSIANGDWRSVCFGNDMFVAVRFDSNTSAFSLDGKTWADSELPSGNWISIAFGNNKFVAVGEDKIIYSSDGINWSNEGINIDGKLPSSYDINMVEIIFKYNQFFTIGLHTGMTSTDGINWITYNFDGENWKGICYGDEGFMVVSPNRIALVNDNNTYNRTLPTTLSSATWTSIAYGNNKYVAISDNSSYTAYSEDGNKWLAGNLSSHDMWKKIIFEDNKFIAISDTKICYSVDGLEWIEFAMAGFKGITFGKKKYVAVGVNKAAYSKTLSFSYYINKLVFFG